MEGDAEGIEMRRLTIALLSVCLVDVSAIPAVAQDQSPAPWFGGRVEMHEHGFAVTLPADWVACDTTVDTLSQLEAASAALDPRLWSTDDAGFLAGLAGLASRCVRLRGSGVSPAAVEAVASRLFKKYTDDPLARDVELPQSLDLPAGPAYLMRVSERDEPGVGEWWPSSIYMLSTDETVLMAFYTTKVARPEGEWLSIVETIEILPAEEQSDP